MYRTKVTSASTSAVGFAMRESFTPKCLISTAPTRSRDVSDSADSAVIGDL